MSIKIQSFIVGCLLLLPMVSFADEVMDKLKSELNITSQQESAWNAYANASDANKKSAQEALVKQLTPEQNQKFNAVQAGGAKEGKELNDNAKEDMRENN